MLPQDTDARSQDKKPAATTQTSLDPHLEEQNATVPYSDALFRDAALEWLIQTDQVRNAPVLPFYTRRAVHWTSNHVPWCDIQCRPLWASPLLSSNVVALEPAGPLHRTKGEAMEGD